MIPKPATVILFFLFFLLVGFNCYNNIFGMEKETIVKEKNNHSMIFYQHESDQIGIMHINGKNYTVNISEPLKITCPTKQGNKISRFVKLQKFSDLKLVSPNAAILNSAEPIKDEVLSAYYCEKLWAY